MLKKIIKITEIIKGVDMKTQLLLYPKTFKKKKKKLIRTKVKVYFINLEIIGKEKLYIFLKSKNLKNFCNMVKPLGTTMASKPNLYYILLYDDMIYIK